MNKFKDKTKQFFQSVNDELTRRPYRFYLPFPVRYHEKYLGPPLAFFVGIFMVLYGSGYGFWTAFRMRAFWKAAIPSMLAAWLMIRYIIGHTCMLDERHPWYATWFPRPLKRVGWQLWYGIAVPCFAVLIFYAFYFVVRYRPGLFWRYLREDFPFVLLMLSGFNLLLWAYYRLQAVEIVKHWNLTRRRKVESAVASELRPGVVIIPYGDKIRDSIALFEPGLKKNKTGAVGFDGKTGVDFRTLTEIMEEVRGIHYYRVHRSLIVNRSIIRGLRKTEKGVFVVLDTPRKGEEVRVSNGRTAGFLEWYERASSSDREDL
ncbi:LytTR family transcriptional regulator DNA-binding domain-containing protein [Sinomicrobium sp. M5D2P17]